MSNISTEYYGKDFIKLEIQHNDDFANKDKLIIQLNKQGEIHSNRKIAIYKKVGKTITKINVLNGIITNKHQNSICNKKTTPAISISNGINLRKISVIKGQIVNNQIFIKRILVESFNENLKISISIEDLITNFIEETQ